MLIFQSSREDDRIIHIKYLLVDKTVLVLGLLEL